MSLLNHPEARALLAEAGLSSAAVQGCSDRLQSFLRRYLPLFYRAEQRRHARLVIQGRLSGLERKTSEPIAYEAGKPRKPVQTFVGAGKWDDEVVMAEVRRHIGAELADPNAVLVLDGSAFPKKGRESCGVQRQWCGHLGKIDNCQVGVFLAYAAAGGWAPLDRRLYLPREWAEDKKRRKKTHVPKGVAFQEKWQIGREMLSRAAALPHGWVAADDEFGRVGPLRKCLREQGERYVLDVPRDTLVRDLEARPPRRRRAKGKKRKTPFCRAETWAARQPPSRWQRFTIRAGEKGPLEVEAMMVRVQTKADNRLGPEERLVVVRTREAEPQISYALSNASAETPLAELVRVKSERHRIEEMFEAGNGAVGLDHYEVRGWVGWHHHMTLALLALWFLRLERRRLGGENPGLDGGANAGSLQPLAPPSATVPASHCCRRQPSTAA